MFGILALLGFLGVAVAGFGVSIETDDVGDENESL